MYNSIVVLVVLLLLVGCQALSGAGVMQIVEKCKDHGGVDLVYISPASGVTRATCIDGSVVKVEVYK